jgi:mRNA interferase RelE/StbE
MARYRVFFKPSADKALGRLPQTVQRRIVAAVEELQENPRPPGCVKLTGEGDLWRIRAGDHRVVYTVCSDELTVLVVRVAHRKDVYRG